MGVWMKNIIIAPVGDNIDALYVGIREFPTEKVYLLAPSDKMDKVDKAKNTLNTLKIPVSIVPIKGNLWENTFRAISEITKNEAGKNLLVNVSTGDTITRCAVTSGAFVNGLKAFFVSNDEIMLLPVLKFSYYRLISDQKMRILDILNNEENCCSSLEELSKKTRMSLPLVSYHINGNQKSEGLKKMGLIETTELGARVEVHLSLLGRMLMKGYISPDLGN